MSTGFRIFLLILFAFGATYAYRFREAQLSQWLRGQPAQSLDSERDGLISPVDRILESDVSLARLIGQPIPRPARPRTRAKDLHADLSSAGSFAEGLPVEEQLSAADLADSGEESWGDAAAEAATGGSEEPASPADEDAVSAEPPQKVVEPSPVGGAQQELVGYTEVAYTVEPGDNLWKIATKALGSGARFGEIRAMNPDVFRGKSTDALAVGTVLRIQIPAPADSLKVPRADADTTVEGNSARGSVESRRNAPRQSVKQIEKSKKIAGR